MTSPSVQADSVRQFSPIEQRARRQSLAREIESTTAEFWQAIDAVRHPLQSLANLPFEDERRWLGQAACAVSVLHDADLIPQLREIPRHPRWRRRSEGGSSNAAAAEEYVYRILIAVADRDASIAAANLSEATSDPQILCELNWALRHILIYLLNRHAERVSPPFSERLEGPRKELGAIYFDDIPHQLRDVRPELSAATRCALHELAAAQAWGAFNLPLLDLPHIEPRCKDPQPDDQIEPPQGQSVAPQSPTWVSRCDGSLLCSPDGLVVRRGEDEFGLSTGQALVVKHMANGFEHRPPRTRFTHNELVRVSESASEMLSDVFKRSNAWNSLVVPVEGERGMYTLRLGGVD